MNRTHEAGGLAGEQVTFRLYLTRPTHAVVFPVFTPSHWCFVLRCLVWTRLLTNQSTFYSEVSLSFSMQDNASIPPLRTGHRQQLFAISSACFSISWY